MKKFIGKYFLTGIFLLSLTISSCSNNFFIYEDNGFLKTLVNFDYYLYQTVGEHDLSYEYFFKGYSNEDYFNQHNRFYSYTFDFDHDISTFYYIYLKDECFNKFNDGNEYDSNFINGHFLNSYNNYFKGDYSKLKIYKNEEFKYFNRVKNYKLIAVLESYEITCLNNLSNKTDVNKKYNVLNNLIIKNKKMEYKWKNKYEKAIYTCYAIDDQYYLNFPNIQTSYLNGYYANNFYFSSNIYNIDNKEYVLMKRYDYYFDKIIDYLDESINYEEISSPYIIDLFGDYKKEALSAFCKLKEGSNSYGYYSLDMIKEFLS